MAIAVTNTGTSTSTGLGFTATAGRIVVASVSQRDSGCTYSPADGWAELAAYAPNASGRPPSWLIGRVAAGGETVVGGTFPASAAVKGTVALEVTGSTLATLVGSSTSGSTNVGGPYTLSGPTLTPTAGAECLLIVSFAFSRVESVTDPSGWTLAGSVVANSADWPYLRTFYRLIASASGSYTPQITSVNDNHHYGSSAAIMYLGNNATVQGVII